MRDMDELVVTEVAAHWQRVALTLGMDIGVSKAVLQNNPTDCERACRDMLDRWLREERNTGEEKRAWSTLGLAPEAIEACYGSYPRKERVTANIL